MTKAKREKEEREKGQKENMKKKHKREIMIKVKTVIEKQKI